MPLILMFLLMGLLRVVGRILADPHSIQSMVDRKCAVITREKRKSNRPRDRPNRVHD